MMIFRFQRLIFAYPQVSYCEFERKKITQVAFFSTKKTLSNCQMVKYKIQSEKWGSLIRITALSGK